MINRVEPANERFLFDLARTAKRLERAQREISSGKRVNAASDAPDRLSTLLQARTSLDMMEQTKVDFGRIKTEVDTAENALGSAVKVMEQARVIALRGATGTATPEARTSFAEEVQGLMEQTVSIANTVVEGRYIFSGDSDGVKPFVLDWSQTPPAGSYQGSPATRQAIHPNGTRVSIARTAEEIFDRPEAGKSVLAALESLRTALLANDATAIEAAMTDVGTAGAYLNSMHATYGATQAQVNDAIDSAYKAEVRLKNQIGTIEDADITASALEISEARFQHEAALQTKARVGRRSLFDYLA